MEYKNTSLTERDSKTIWHPYTQMKHWPEAIGIVSGRGALLTDEDGKEYIDAISSWWVNLHGHSHPYIAEKITEQLQRLEHCIFAGFTHEPAVRLAERLLNILPGPMSRIFYSDNGSTAVEVAIKMSLQFWTNKGEKRTRIAVLENGYHGDTFGAMSVSQRGLFTLSFEEKLFEVDVIPLPTAGNEERSFNRLEDILRQKNTAAFIVEPLVQGAAGMLMYDNDKLNSLFSLCRQYGTLVVADEVMTGFGRTGRLFACDGGVSPDILCLSKGLTGGTLPLGITACTKEIFDMFHDDAHHKALYHGHSFTANPIACTAALASLDLLLTDRCKNKIGNIIRLHQEFSGEIRNNHMVTNLRQTGTILAFDLRTDEPSGYSHSLRNKIYTFFIEKGVLIRPLGNIIYLIPPYCITKKQLLKIYGEIEELLYILSKSETK